MLGSPPFRRCPSPLPPLLRPSVLQIEQVDAEQLEAEILNRDRPLIIDFYATWCGPCVLLAKELETVRTSAMRGLIVEQGRTIRLWAAPFPLGQHWRRRGSIL